MVFDTARTVCHISVTEHYATSAESQLLLLRFLIAIAAFFHHYRSSISMQATSGRGVRWLGAKSSRSLIPFSIRKPFERPICRYFRRPKGSFELS